MARSQAARDPWLERIGAQMQRGDFHGALAALLPAVQGPGAGARVFEYTVICFLELRDAATAEALAEAALARFPADVWLWSLKARICLHNGDAELAQAALRRALDIAPGHLGALTTLNLIAPFARGSREDRRLRRAVKAAGHGTRERAAGYNAIGRIEAAAGNVAAAFHHFTRCNRLRGGTFDPDADKADIAAQAQLPAGPATDGPVPYVFIGGMPRSGTTVLDAALRRNPDVTGLGETTTLSALFRRARTLAGPGAGRWPARLTAAHRAALRGDLIAAFDRARDGHTVVIEKMPLACLYSGFAHWLLPEARFVQMARHPLDCGLSNYITNFDQPHGWSTRLDWIAAKFRATETAADLWSRHLGRAFRRQSFRALVEDPEAELRAVLRHIGLDWNAACLAPEAAGPQHTASMLQVRAGFNTAGLGKWRVFEKQLAPLVEALGGPETIATWEARDAAAPCPAE